MTTVQPVLVIGATGQVGHALVHALRDRVPVVAAGRQGQGLAVADLTDITGLLRLVRDLRPRAIINAAAYTAVDKAEAEESLAFQINAEAPGQLAAAAKELGAAFIHYSTDYVFNGEGTHARREDEATAPLNAYGRTKLAGEQRVRSANPEALIFRTSWVFSEHGHNFVKTMLKLGTERELLRIVADQVGAPTSAAYIAAMTAKALTTGLTAGFGRLGGIYHLCCAGGTTWYEFATTVFAEARARRWPLKVQTVEPIETVAYPLPAARPLNSRLDCTKLYTTFAEEPYPWQLALRTVMAELTAAAAH